VKYPRWSELVQCVTVINEWFTI